MHLNTYFPVCCSDFKKSDRLIDYNYFHIKKRNIWQIAIIISKIYDSSSNPKSRTHDPDNNNFIDFCFAEIKIIVNYKLSKNNKQKKTLIHQTRTPHPSNAKRPSHNV
jgi:hypothetical protein